MDRRRQNFRRSLHGRIFKCRVILVVDVAALIGIIDDTVFGRNGIQTKIPANLFSNVFVHRTGMGLLFRDTHFGQQFKHTLRLDLQLPGQFIDPNLLHK